MIGDLCGLKMVSFITDHRCAPAELTPPAIHDEGQGVAMAPDSGTNILNFGVGLLTTRFKTGSNDCEWPRDDLAVWGIW